MRQLSLWWCVWEITDVLGDECRSWIHLSGSMGTCEIAWNRSQRGAAARTGAERLGAVRSFGGSHSD